MQTTITTTTTPMVQQSTTSTTPVSTIYGHNAATHRSKLCPHPSSSPSDTGPSILCIKQRRIRIQKAQNDRLRRAALPHLPESEWLLQRIYMNGGWLYSLHRNAARSSKRIKHTHTLAHTCLNYCESRKQRATAARHRRSALQFQYQALDVELILRFTHPPPTDAQPSAACSATCISTLTNLLETSQSFRQTSLSSASATIPPATYNISAITRMCATGACTLVCRCAADVRCAASSVSQAGPPLLRECVLGMSLASACCLSVCRSRSEPGLSSTRCRCRRRRRCCFFSGP